MDLVIGVDYGTDSVRSVVVDTATGEALGSGVFNYPRWKEGRFCDAGASQFRQHPADYVDGLEKSIKMALSASPPGSANRVAAIGVDMTGSTPAPVDARGVPLALLPEFKDNPNGMFVLWKDHTAIAEAEEINTLAKEWPGGDYTRFCGGTYSSEWYWSKALHLLRCDAMVAEAAHGFIECSDWIPALLSGATDPAVIRRNRCAAGHKAMWNSAWGGLPPAEFFRQLDVRLGELRFAMPAETYPADTIAGRLCAEWSERLGLSRDVIVGCGLIDAHAGAVGGGVRPGTLLKIVGTSTCDMAVVEPAVMGDRLIDGICGQVDGSIIPGLIGVEAGQSAFGDIFAWFKSLLAWPAEQVDITPELVSSINDSILLKLESSALEEAAGSSVLATDWFNGRRTPHANPWLKAGLTGLSLGSTAPAIYRALVEAACFGSRRIHDCMTGQGIEINEVICVGGVALKSKLVMQTMADVLNVPVKVAALEQGCAIGGAMLAAAAAGIHDGVLAAQAAMGGGISQVYKPNAATAQIYREKYQQYLEFGNYIEQGRK